MKRIFEIVKNNPLFMDIGIADFDKMFLCLGAKAENYRKGEVVFLSGNPITAVGLVLSGGVRVVREDIDGRSHTLAELGAGELFGETLVCAAVDHSPVTVLAAESSEILLLNYRKIIATCAESCNFHNKLIENMLTIMAQKNLFLSRKIEILSKRTIRERLMLFFDLRQGTAKKFTLPYNREELAALLCVDRSAMSAELSKMQADGIIRFHKNQFELL